MSSALVQSAERISWEQFLELPDLPGGLHAVALIDGEVVWLGSPSGWHEHIVHKVVNAVDAWAGPGLLNGRAVTRPAVQIPGAERIRGTRNEEAPQAMTARPQGYEADAGWFPPAQVRLDATGALEFVGRPAIVVEVWSPSNWAKEIERKVEDYALAGVAELWAISPTSRAVTRYADIVDGAYASIIDLSGDDVLTTPLLDGFAIPVSSLFVV